jgi:uncharacterized caspase-like protein
MLLKRFGIFAVAGLLLLGAMQAKAEGRVVLIIGNSDYRHTTTLKNPENDANELAFVLESLGFSVVTGSNLSLSEFKSTLQKFAGMLRGSETALFFYAGHGIQIDSENWLLPTDAKLQSELDLTLETIPLRAILTTMEQAAKVRLVFLDACRDNPMAVQLAQGMGTRSTAAVLPASRPASAR